MLKLWSQTMVKQEELLINLEVMKLKLKGILKLNYRRLRIPCLAGMKAEVKCLIDGIRIFKYLRFLPLYQQVKLEENYKEIVWELFWRDLKYWFRIIVYKNRAVSWKAMELARKCELSAWERALWEEHLEETRLELATPLYQDDSSGEEMDSSLFRHTDDDLSTITSSSTDVSYSQDDPDDSPFTQLQLSNWSFK